MTGGVDASPEQVQATEQVQANAQTISALRLVEEFARASTTLDGSLLDLSKSASEFAFASDLPDGERVALYYALYSVVEAISAATTRGRQTADAEYKALTEAAKEKAETTTNRVCSFCVAGVCLLVVFVALYYREGETAANAFLVFLLIAAPKICAKAFEFLRGKGCDG